MADQSFLNWPFFEDRHRDLAMALDSWCQSNLVVDHSDVDAACRKLVADLGAAGWLQHTGGKLDVRTLALIRETLARHDGLADFSFAMQGLGTGAISLFGTRDQQDEWLPETVASVDAPIGSSEPAPAGMTLMPVRCRLVVRDSEGDPLMQLNVVHHWESN